MTEDEMKKDDPEAYEGAKESQRLTIQGRTITKEAALDAAKQMQKMVGNMGSKTGKIEALKHHSLYMGIGTEFMEIVMPIISSMVDDFEKMDMDKEEAMIMRKFYIAKVFMNIEKGIKKNGNT